MREILFKAKRIDNGEWVKGELVRRKSYGTDDVIEAHIIIDAYEQSNFMNFGWQPVLISPLAIDKYDEGCYRVNPGTICQYTGLTDKNGCKIWENDILEWEYETLPSDYYECVWLKDECAFAFKHGNDYTNPVDCWDVDYTDSFSLKVIGNVFDNPELLES